MKINHTLMILNLCYSIEYFLCIITVTDNRTVPLAFKISNIGNYRFVESKGNS